MAMNRITRTRSAALALALPFAFVGAIACSSTSSGKGSSGETAGKQCGRVIDAYCKRAINDCGVTGTVDQCVSDGTNACCGTQCNVNATSSASSVDTCVSAMKALTCDEVNAGTVPASCNKVVTVSSAVIQPSGFGAALLGEE